MGIRNFFRLLVRGMPAERPARHTGHDVADTVRDAMGPLGGGGGGHGSNGRMSGNAVYKHLEKSVGPNHPEPESD